jgi:hypothetical protein
MNTNKLLMSGHPLTEMLLSNSDESEEDLQEVLNEVEVEEKVEVKFGVK